MGPPSYTENSLQLHEISIPYLIKKCKPFFNNFIHYLTDEPAKQDSIENAQ
mgnify:FL=1